ncbi:NAD-dependent protein deacetylase sirtuin-2 isoform 2-T2 [Ciconia maguari]
MAEPDAPGARGDEAEQDAESPASDTEPGASGDSEMELLRSLLSRTLGLGGEKPEKVLDELTLEGVSRFLRSERCKNVVCMVGAGISTSAGIPDFRSPGTGLYANLQSYDLPYPEAIFEISFFKQHPEPFFALARELYPGQFKPTVCHYFMRLLQEKGLLLRCYTQNIDTLERVAGLEPELLVEAHGTFFTSHCLRPSCRQPYGLQWMKERIFSSLVPKCEKCQSVVKPGLPEGRPPPHHGHLAAGPALRLPRQQGPHQHPPAPHQQGEDGAGTWPGWGSATPAAWPWPSCWAGRRSWRSWCGGSTPPSTPRPPGRATARPGGATARPRGTLASARGAAGTPRRSAGGPGH